ncbi:hypothetical protein GQ37_013815 [Janthinobacterium sp. BJB1]|nr:hypothetical protein CSQ90_19375 [Janthinobacterium sp. BJB303]PJC98135.1 hypothetical protein GQ37_013815 [Janthinobacterium sp. BJB1]
MEEEWNVVCRVTTQTTTYFGPGGDGNVRFRLPHYQYGALRIVQPCILATILCTRNFKDIATEQLS